MQMLKYCFVFQPKCRSRKCWTTGAWPGAGAVTRIPTALPGVGVVGAQAMGTPGTGQYSHSSGASGNPGGAQVQL